MLLRVFLRSLFLQASWNPKGMQNLGLAYSLYPALEQLYPDKADLEAAVRRHLVFFNTHPYVAAAIVGGVLNHEQRIAQGEETAGQGGGLQGRARWGRWRRWGMASSGCRSSRRWARCARRWCPLLHAWAVLLFLVLYNVVHLTLRARFYWMGLSLGDRLVEAVARANLPTRGARLRSVAAACAGGLAAWLAADLGKTAGGEPCALAGGGLSGTGRRVLRARSTTGAQLRRAVPCRGPGVRGGSIS